MSLLLTLSGHTQRRIAIAALDFWRFQACAANVSFDHLVCAAKQRQRESEAERLGGLQVDD